eukprot:6802683-Prymnesium_polylepis.1
MPILFGLFPNRNSQFGPLSQPTPKNLAATAAPQHTANAVASFAFGQRRARLLGVPRALNGTPTAPPTPMDAAGTLRSTAGSTWLR